MSDTLKLFKDLTEANGISGNEREARAVMKKHIEPYATSVYTDHLGSLIAEKVGQKEGPKVMVAGHLDEIGLMVTRIDDNGFLYFQTIGGWWNQVMLAQRVTVMTSEENLVGIIGSKPPHIMTAEARKKPYEIKDMFIDIGATSKEEAESFGVKPGDSVVPYFEFQSMKNEKLLLAKAWDNRIGCAIAVEVLKQLQDVEHPNTVYGVGTVQEEVGLRGAKTAANSINPDIGFAVDTGIAGDTPGITANEADSKIGEGPQIIIYDASMISHKGLRDFVIKTAEDNDIPYQFATLAAGGTDSGSIHLTSNGVPTLSIGIATRYIHSHAGIIHRDDFDHTVKLMVEIIKGLDQEQVKQITFD
ncbi:endoglucanase [Pelagirhabdus alkalitolerans]|uniref:Endoglucanase n=1 Tax=Pelagirhabdus alkalitolerans TaxID=1612202 RepID=A0A1G6HL70_9BACI|nr:M42 family metallopeptidase [Pelagirhabdus alkalitolerans]SDB94934.1 endoglucanase [Pelagirhabdus alkalitolerans]